LYHTTFITLNQGCIDESLYDLLYCISEGKNDHFKIKHIVAYNQRKYRMIRILEDLVISKDYVMFEPPFFENYDQLKKMNKNIVNQQTIKVINDDSDIFILRPDATTGIMKSLIPKWQDQDVLKLFYRTTTFTSLQDIGMIEKEQFGIEYLGSNDIFSDLEVVYLALTVLKQFNLDFMLEMSNNKLLQALIERMNLSAHDLKQFKTIMTYKNKHEFLRFISKQSFDQDTITVLKMIFDLQGSYQEIEEKLKSCPACSFVKEVLEDLKAFNYHIGNQDRLTYDLSMMPQFDYYEGFTFKAYIRNTPEPILSGGRYNPLAKAFGKNMGAVGFSLNLNILLQEVK
jgi:ATP phosphoribosyltransferase regulatory subunit